MGNVLVQESSLQAIATAIRAKNGSSDTYRPREMAAAIGAIPTGGGGNLPSGLLIGTSTPDAGIGLDGNTYLQYADFADSVASNGRCAVHGDYTVTVSCMVEVKFYLTELTTSFEYIATAAYSPASDTGYFAIGFEEGANGALVVYWSASSTGSRQSYTSPDFTKEDFLNCPHTVTLDAGRVYVDGTLVHTFTGAPGDDTETNYSDLFAIKTSSGYVNYATHAAIQSCKIWNSGGTLVRNYLPYNDSGVVKVRDEVTGTVYTPTGTALVFVNRHKHVVQEWLKQNGSWEIIQL